jgi:two-component system response regulator VanR
LSINAYDIAVLDRDIPGPYGDEIAEGIIASASGMPILMLTAVDRLDDKASGFGLGADDYLTEPFEQQELVLRLRALDRRRAHNRPPVREIAGLRLGALLVPESRSGRTSPSFQNTAPQGCFTVATSPTAALAVDGGGHRTVHT